MTLNVDLEEVPFAILEAVKARILANRRRLQQGQQQGPRRSLRPRPQRPRIGASSKSWRMPKEAAGVFESLTLTHLWTEGGFVSSYANPGGGLNDGIYEFTEIFTPDPNPGGNTRIDWRYILTKSAQSTSIEESSTQKVFFEIGSGNREIFSRQLTDIASADQSANVFFVPTGQESAIAIFYGYNITTTINTVTRTDYVTNTIYNEDIEPTPSRPYPTEQSFREAVYSGLLYNATKVLSYSAQSNANTYQKAIAFNKSSAREVTVPSKLLPLLNVLNPIETAQESVFVQPLQGNAFYYTWESKYRPSGVPSIGGDTIGPQVFAEINNLSVEEGLGALLPDVNTLSLSQYVSEDTERSINREQITSGGGLYAYQVSNNPELDNSQYDSDLDYRYPVELETASAFNSPSSKWRSHFAVTTADEDDYCRRMCLALGFQPSDLQP